MKKELDPIYLPYKWGGQHVAGIWQYLIPKEGREWQVPDERNSTCNDCPNVAAEGYSPRHRCCSYHPVVPNYQIGLALQTKGSRKPLLELYKAGLFTPEGYERTPHQWVDYIVDLAEDKFGRGGRVQCPLLQVPSGLCSIYAFRNAACSTFYCRNDHGAAGEKFWEAVSDYISQIEIVLSQWAMEQLGFNIKKYFKKHDKLAKDLPSVARPDTKGWKDEVLKYLWEDWYGREIEFLEACGDLVSKHRDELVEISEAQKLRESKKIDAAMNKMVPKKAQHEIEDDDDDDDDEAAKPSELWATTKKRYRKLWKVPDKLKLSQRAVFKKNPKKSKEDRHQAMKPYMVEFMTRKGGNTIDWHQYLSEDEYQALKKFRKKRKVNQDLMGEITFQNPTQFLSEWHCKRVLEKR